MGIPKKKTTLTQPKKKVPLRTDRPSHPIQPTKHNSWCPQNALYSKAGRWGKGGGRKETRREGKGREGKGRKERRREREGKERKGKRGPGGKRWCVWRKGHKCLSNLLLLPLQRPASTLRSEAKRSKAKQSKVNQQTNAPLEEKKSRKTPYLFPRPSTI